MGSIKTYLINIKPQKFRFKEKCLSKSVYVVVPLAALIKIRSWGAPILFFAVWCTNILTSKTTTALLYNLTILTNYSSKVNKLLFK